MRKMRSVLCLLLLCCSAAFVAAQRSSNVTSKWKTLSGDAPKVIARGGFSGLLPDSSYNAYLLAQAISLADWVAWCDVQLTKDGVGICFPDIKLNNASDIDTLYLNRNNNYSVNGIPQTGWFSIDFNIKDLAPVSLKQGVYSRSPRFDGTPQQILTVQDVATQVKPPGLWLNIQHDSFYSQHNLSMRSFVISLSRSVIANYISSPEVNFLRSIASRLNPRVTKRVFRFLNKDDIEPSTSQTYGSLVKNLTFIKTFAAGILVPKHYIWPTDSSLYLQPQPLTSVVLDAHKEGLEIYAADFVNDVPFAYNYSYDPVAEYLSFIDNGEFSVDGVLSDFPMSSSASVDCFSHLGANDKPQVKLQIIAPQGASGDYPGCTDLAYTKAASDGADILGCPVQMTKDGIPFCLGSINLIDTTTVAQSPFSDIATTVPELQITNGILTINLSWSDIQTLKPAISTRYSDFRLLRNPKARNDGNFMSLADFLTFSKNANVSGVMISIENAPYLAKQGLGVTDAVSNALSTAGYNNQTARKVMIQSNDSSVLEEFKKSSYELVYLIDEDISDIKNSTLLEIKTFAKSVVITKKSVFPSEEAFIIGQTNVVQKLQSANLPVYVRLFNNEFISQAWDFFSDSSAELNNYVLGAGVDGLVTEYPGTAARYRRNRCLAYKDLPPYMRPVQPGSLLGLMTLQSMPPIEPPSPVLDVSDVTEPPLPPVAKIKPSNDNGSTARAPTTAPNGQSSVVASILMSSVAVLLAIFMVY